MRTAITALLACIVLGLVGCGGGGDKNNNGASTTSMVPEQYMAALEAAIETRDRDFIANQISDDYFEDCETKEGLLNRIMSVLGSGGTIDFTFVAPTNKRVNELRNSAEFDGGFTLTVTEGADTRTLTESGRLFLHRDNSPWQLYGDQTCVH
ncbi:MAG: hypothetical protein ACAH95_10775 [Fimbriimonas sp.]